jgi:ubiquinone/menaquinone biosynthesis C-methylase UbiE
VSIYNYLNFPTSEEVINEWKSRAEREGLSSVMRKSHDKELTEAAAAEMEIAVIRFLDNNYGSLAGKKILEIGTGIGRFTKILSEKAKSVTTVDMTSAMIDRAKKNLSDCDNITFIESDIKSLSVVHNEFDLVFDVWVLMHILDEKDFKKSLDVITKSTKNVFICEYTNQGEHAVGRYSILRSDDEYSEAVSMSLVAQDEFYYGGDRSSLMLFKK